MTKNTLVRRAIHLALANAAAASVALPALASPAPQPQTVPQPSSTSSTSNQPPAPVAALHEVVVTGSRIYIPGLKSISPVTSISAKTIAETGATTIEDVLNQLPQVTADQGAMSSNGATGTASVNLRDLGPNRTLVLVDGRRLMPGDSGTNVADIDNIPAALVQRVDVLTGGASSVYGADAVAGVVNFVMNDHFQGFQIDANASAYQHDQHSTFYGGFAPATGYGKASSSLMDGAEKDVTFILGSDFAGGKGNATGYLSYRTSQPVLQASRDFSRCTLATNSHGAVSCSGSSTSATGGFFATDAPGQNGYNFGMFESTVNPATGEFTQYPGGVGFPHFNYGTYNYYIRPDTRWNGGFFTHYNIDDNHQVFADFMFMQDHTNAQIAPSGAFLASGLGVNPVTGVPNGGWSVNCNNPLLSAGEQSTLCGTAATGVASVAFGRRNVEGGNRVDDLTHTGFLMTIGSKGNITNNLSYDVYLQEGLTLLTENYQNDLSKRKLTLALNDVLQNGQVVCAANANGANGAPGCVPYDIWGLGTPLSAQYTNAAGGPTAASVAYVGAPGLSQSRTEERIYHADFTYDGTSAGWKLPTANEGLVTNFGFEYRSDFTKFIPDEEFLTGDLAGQGGATLPLSGSLGVKEAFIEMRLPLVEDKPFMKEISINPGYRFSKYDAGFSTNTYKIGADWSPDSSFRVRVGYNRAVRAPNLGELFATQTVQLDGSTDPCATGGFGTTAGYVTSAPNNAQLEAARKSACLAHGVTAAQYGQNGLPGNPAGQYNGLTGGNPNLKPETADTYTFGLVYTPTYVPSLSATIDYYDIKITNVISTYGANLIVNQCVLSNNPFFCGFVHRDGSGSIWLSNTGYVYDPLENLGFLWERGADVGVHYRESLGRFGAIDYTFNGTYVGSFITEPYAGSGSYNCAGYFGGTCGNPLPKWRHVLSATWETPIPSLDVGVRWRHFGNTEIDAANPSPLLSGTFQKDSQWTGTRDYLDLSAGYTVVKGVQVIVGCNNVLDKDPPVLANDTLPPPFFNGNTYPQVYDTLGRYVFMNIKADL